MNEKIKLNCHLWYSDNPGNKVGGVITFIPEEGIRLNLFNRFNQDFRSTNSIFGITSQNNKVTLKNIIKINELEFIAKDLFIGDNLADIDINFNYFLVNFSLLEEWSELTHFSISNEDNLSNPPFISEGDKIIKKFYYEFPKIKKVIINNFQISLISIVNTHTTYFKKSSVELKAYIKIEGIENSLQYNEAIDIIDIIQNFLTLGIGIPIKIQELKGFRTENEKMKKIEIYRSQKGTNFRTNIHQLRMNFQLTDIKDDFENILKTWFEKNIKLKSIINLYFGVLYSPFLYSEHEFLSLCQALEVYCRINCDNYYLDDTTYEQMYSDLCEYLNGNIKNSGKNLKEKYNLQKDLLDHLKKGTFKYANEYSLRKKLKVITNKFKKILEDLPYNCVKKIDLIAKVRNYFTHYTEELREEVENIIGKERELALGLRQMLEACMLSEIKIPEKQIKQRLQNRYEGFNFIYWDH